MAAGTLKLNGLYGPWRDWCQWAVRALDYLGFQPTVTSGKRDSAKQQQLYQDYLAGRSKYPAAPPGRSAHEYGLAMDIVAGNGRQSEMMATLQSWGGELVAGDDVHVQYPGFRQWLNG